MFSGAAMMRMTVDWAAPLFEAAGTIVMTLGAVVALVLSLRERAGGVYKRFRNRLGRAIILGLVNAAGYGIFIACVLAVLATSAIGFLNGLIITAGKIPDFVVTLGTLSGITGLGLILSGGEPTMVGSTFLLRLASGSFGPFGYPVWVAIAAVISVAASIRSGMTE